MRPFNHNDVPNSISVLIATIIVSILLLIFSETIPKTIAVRNSEKVALLAVKALKKVSYLFFPFVWFLEKISKITGRLFGIKDASIISEEEISYAAVSYKRRHYVNVLCIVPWWHS